MLKQITIMAVFGFMSMANAQSETPVRFDHTSIVDIDPSHIIAEGDATCLKLIKLVKPTGLSGKPWICFANPIQDSLAPANCQIEEFPGRPYPMSGVADLQTGSYKLNANEANFSTKEDPGQKFMFVRFESGVINQPNGIQELRSYERTVWWKERKQMRKAPADVTYQCRLIYQVTNSFL